VCAGADSENPVLAPHPTPVAIALQRSLGNRSLSRIITAGCGTLSGPTVHCGRSRPGAPRKN